VVEKSPITCVLWPSVWCASPGTSPGGYVRWLFVFERRVRAAVDQDRARGPYSVFARLRQPAAGRKGAEPRHQAGAGGARAARELAAAFLSG
jgi:hypothetical protein